EDADDADAEADVGQQPPCPAETCRSCHGRSRWRTKPLSHRDKKATRSGGWGEGRAKPAMFSCTRLRPYPHPALRATFSQREKEWQVTSPRAGPARRR